MKKWKVVLDRLSTVREDGSRDFLGRKIICTCDTQGTALLICSRIENDYKALTDRNEPNASMYMLTVAQ